MTATRSVGLVAVFSMFVVSSAGHARRTDTASRSIEAHGAQNQSITYSAIVLTRDNKPLSKGRVLIEGDGTYSLKQDGQFDFTVADPEIDYVIFHVLDDWIVVKPCEAQNGRGLLPHHGRTPIEISVVARGDLIPHVVRCVIIEANLQSPSGLSSQTHPPTIPRRLLERSGGSFEPVVYVNGRKQGRELPKLEEYPDFHWLMSTKQADSPSVDHSEFLKRKAGELGIPVETLSLAIDKWIKTSEGSFDKGIAALYLGQYQQAETFLSESLKSSDVKDSSTGYLLLARAQFGSGNVLAAATTLQKVLSVHPRDATAKQQLRYVERATPRTMAGPTPRPAPCDTLHSSIGSVHPTIHGLTILPIPNEPFAAKETVDWFRQNDDGSFFCGRFYTIVARDEAGRVRRENRTRIEEFTTNEPRLNSFIFLDPVAKKMTQCFPADRRCKVQSYQLPDDTVSDWVADSGSYIGSERRISLGTSTIGGLPVMGIQVVKISAEPAADGGPIVISDEIWHSDKLQVTIYEVRDDPTVGKIFIQLTDWKSGKPDASYFNIPSDFEITETGRP